MINDTQQALLKAILDNQLSELNDLKKETQVMAFEAMFSVSYYVEVLAELKAAKIDSEVKTIGEMLSHPAPQNPSQDNVFLPGSIIHPLNVLVKNEQGVQIDAKGLFNLTSKNLPGQEITPRDVSEFVRKTLEEKFKAIDPKAFKRYEKNKNKSPSKKRKHEKQLTEATFLNASIEKQLEYLKMTTLGYTQCNQSNLKIYQLFIGQFSLPEVNTIPEVNAQLKLIHKVHLDNLESMQGTTGKDNGKLLTLCHVIEACLNRFETFLADPKANFTNFKALQKIALGHKYLTTIDYLEPDFASIAHTLISTEQSKVLLEVLKKDGQNISSFHANFLLNLVIEQRVINVTYVGMLLLYTPVDYEYVFKSFIKFIGTDNELTDLYVQLLRAKSFSQELPLDIATIAYDKAVASHNFEFQSLVLMHSPDEFAESKNFNANTFYELIKQEYYAAAIQMVRIHFPNILTTKDLNKAKSLSNNRFEFYDIAPAITFSHRLVSPSFQQYQSATPSLAALATSASQAALDFPSQASSSSLSSSSSSSSLAVRPLRR